MKATLVFFAASIAVLAISQLAYGDAEAGADPEASPFRRAVLSQSSSSKSGRGSSASSSSSSSSSSKTVSRCRCRRKKRSCRSTSSSCGTTGCPATSGGSGTITGSDTGSNTGNTGSGNTGSNNSGSNNSGSNNSGSNNSGSNNSGGVVGTSGTIVSSAASNDGTVTTTAASSSSASSNTDTTTSAADATLPDSSTYCSLSCNGVENIGCNKSVGLSADCPAGAQLIQFSQDDIDMWLRLDNDRRNQVANGSLSSSGYQPAANMVRTTWNAELARQATFLVQSCVYEHDVCRNTAQYGFSGQNIANSFNSAGYYTNAQIIQMTHDNWFNEYQNNAAQYIDSYPENAPDNVSHFTQLSKYNSPQFGCAAVNLPVNGNFQTNVVCNYACTNIVDRPVYITGASCSSCTLGCDTTYPALCPVGEPVTCP